MTRQIEVLRKDLQKSEESRIKLADELRSKETALIDMRMQVQKAEMDLGETETKNKRLTDMMETNLFNKA